MTKAEREFSQLISKEASMALGDWCQRQFANGHTLESVKDAIRRAMKVVEDERA